MTVKGLQRNKEYYFECNIKKKKALKDIADTECFDEWGCAYISVGDEIGVEYKNQYEKLVNKYVGDEL